MLKAWGLAVLSVGLAAANAEPTTDELIRQVEDRYNRAQTLSLQFQEDYSIQGHRRPSETGTLLLKKQGKMRWNYSQPTGKLFISDGKNVYLYTAGDNRVEKVPLKDTEDMRAPLAFLLGHLAMKKEFRDFKSHPGSDGTWLDASAGTDRLPYEQVQMLITPSGAIRELKVLNRDQSELTFLFSNEQLNPRLSDTIFRFTIPPGAQVVDAIESGVQEQ